MSSWSPTFTTPKKKLTWLITGCSSGFGLSLARQAQAGGHTVIATSRDPSRTPELAAEVEARGGRWLQLDVDDRDSGRVVEQLEAAGHEIDVLVNNAGGCVYGPLETLAEDEVRALAESMYFGPLRLVRAVVPHMRRRRFGVVVNMSSGAALEGNFTMGAYAGAKAGLDGATKVLAKEVAQYNIRTLTVVLGTFNTNMGNAVVLGKNGLPDDYEDSPAGKIIQFFSGGGKMEPNGDKDKAMKAVYEVVVGEGVGAGRESERFLPLGTDMTARVKLVQDYLAHAQEVFGDVTNSVGLDK